VGRFLDQFRYDDTLGLWTRKLCTSFLLGRATRFPRKCHNRGIANPQAQPTTTVDLGCWGEKALIISSRIADGRFRQADVDELEWTLPLQPRPRMYPSITTHTVGLQELCCPELGNMATIRRSTNVRTASECALSRDPAGVSCSFSASRLASRKPNSLSLNKAIALHSVASRVSPFHHSVTEHEDYFTWAVGNSS
jgi:hypothetical protein